MTFAEWDYMGPDPQLFRRSMAEALATLLGQRYRTAKQLARGVGIDVKTAENLRSGHLSVTTLQKVLRTEGRALWDRLGDELFGETFYQYEERRLQAVIREAEDVRSNLVRLRTQREKLLEGAGLLDDAPVGAKAGQGRRGQGRTRAQADEESLRNPEGQGHHATADSVEGRSFAPSKRGGR